MCRLFLINIKFAVTHYCVRLEFFFFHALGVINIVGLDEDKGYFKNPHTNSCAYGNILDVEFEGANISV